ncbi:MAG: GNAT family protein [Nanoarchaeota archaeon]|nr:GNAT family protein [Nanoarchaeota archaeon]
MIVREIKKDNFRLRHVRLSDAKVFFESEQDKEAKRNFMRTPKNIKEVEKDIKEDILQYKNKKPSSEKFTIEVDGKCAGWIKINQLNMSFFEHKAKIDFCLHPDYRGKGIMTNAVKEVVDYAFKKYKLKRLEAWTRTSNKVVSSLNKKLGFKLEGVLRKNKCKDGEYLDDMVWAIVR